LNFQVFAYVSSPFTKFALASTSQKLHAIQDNALWKRICFNQCVDVYVPERPLISVFGDLSFTEEDTVSPVTDGYKIDYRQVFINDYLRKQRLSRKPRMLASEYPSNTVTRSDPIEIPARTECHECSSMSKSFSPIQQILRLEASPRSSFINHTFTNNCILGSGLRDFDSSPISTTPRSFGDGNMFEIVDRSTRQSESSQYAEETDDPFAGSVVIEL
jgi:hypothetical protein